MTDAGLRRLALWLHQRQARVQVFAAETQQPPEPVDPRLALDAMRLRGIPAVGPHSAGSLEQRLSGRIARTAPWLLASSMI